jgi:surface carbohydrate biosynthesis protein (TIGR04326 family)
VPHTTVPFWHLYYFDDRRTLNSTAPCHLPMADILAVNGRPALKAFLAQGYPPGMLVEVEALRYQHLLEMPRRPVGTPTHDDSVTRVLILGELSPSSMRGLLLELQWLAAHLHPKFEFTLKPHPGYVPDLDEYPALEGRLILQALPHILGDYDIALAANSTSAAVEACVAGLPVVIWLDGEHLNLSPMRGLAGALFAGTRDQLVTALVAASTERRKDTRAKDFFFLDLQLPRWRRLLGC